MSSSESPELSRQILHKEIEALTAEMRPFIGPNTKISSKEHLEAVTNFCRLVFGFAPTQEQLLEKYG